MSWGRFSYDQGATRPGTRPLGRCSTQKPTVVLIDEDDDGDDPSDSEVRIIDGAVASGYQTKKGNASSRNVITIDDDEEVVDGAEGDGSGPGMSHAARSPVATTPRRGFPRNTYGLDCSSDSYDSDSSAGWTSDFSGTSDCEILDDASGTARKVWETAASRKKMPHGIHGRKYGRDTVSTSSDGSEAQQDDNEEGFFDAECHQNEYFQFFSSFQKEVQSSTKDGHGPSEPNGEECPNGKETDRVQNSNGSVKAGPAECHLKEKQFTDSCKESAQSTAGHAKDGYGPSSEPNAYGCSNENVSNLKETDCRASSTMAPDMSCNDKTAHSHESTVPENAPEGMQSPCMGGNFNYSFVSANRVFAASSSADLKDGSPPMSVSTPEKIDEKMPEGAYSHKDQSPPDANIVINRDMYSAQDGGSVSGQQTKVPPFSNKCDCSRQFGENYPQIHSNSCGCAAASIKNTSVNFTSESCPFPQKDSDDGPIELGQSTLVQDASDFQYGLIGEREKHKESVEYKRAAEEEWASRQRQLQIQAEEAKKLRKRKKAEALRLIDMEKRQKQRLQEVRDSQRKNEEDIQLKEQYRGLVRMQLEDTERRHRDMASILRALGIPVDGEVKAAYKQALLKFHPDRVSRTDIYQQVKAEETFKFISRLKENLPRFL